VAWEKVTIARLERVAAKLKESGSKIAKSIEMAKTAGLTELYFQIRDAEKCVDGATTSATRAELHIPDQVECAESGSMPLWQKNQIRSAMNRARNEAKARADALGIVRPPARRGRPPKKVVPVPTKKAKGRGK
jgi:hypothetical protein